MGAGTTLRSREAPAGGRRPSWAPSRCRPARSRARSKFSSVTAAEAASGVAQEASASVRGVTERPTAAGAVPYGSIWFGMRRARRDGGGHDHEHEPRELLGYPGVGGRSTLPGRGLDGVRADLRHDRAPAGEAGSGHLSGRGHYGRAGHRKLASIFDGWYSLRPKGRGRCLQKAIGSDVSTSHSGRRRFAIGIGGSLRQARRCSPVST